MDRPLAASRRSRRCFPPELATDRHGRRVDAHAVGTARPRLNSLSSANRITAPFSVLTSEWMAALLSAIRLRLKPTLTKVHALMFTTVLNPPS
jgi:hypothetical protein